MEEPEDDHYQTFEDLDTYQIARGFRRAMYGVARKLPDFEKFGLASQIRRAAVSLTNNIAEGHGRYHFLDQIKFMLQARGSLEELLDDLNVCEDENYLPPDELAALKENGWQVHKILNGYIRFLRKRASTSRIGEETSDYSGSDTFASLTLRPFNPPTLQLSPCPP